LLQVLMGGLDLHAKGLPRWMVHQDPDHLTHSQTSRILDYVAEKRHTEHEQQVCLTMSKRRFVFNNPKDGLLKPGANRCSPLLHHM